MIYNRLPSCVQVDTEVDLYDMLCVDDYLSCQNNITVDGK